MKSAKDYLKAGDKYRQQKKWQAAVQAYTKAIELDPGDFRSYERCGRVYFELGDYHQTIHNLTCAINLKPNRYLLYDLRGRAYSMLGNQEAVVSDFVKATELHPGHNVYLHKALAFIELGDYSQALDALNRAIDLKVDYAIAYLTRGVIYQTLGEKEKAKADYEHTIDLATNRKWSAQAKKYLQGLNETG